MAAAPAKNDEEDLSGVCWRDDQWLQFFPLTRLSALDYFALSPFYDRSCNNEQAKLQGLDPSKVACAPALLIKHCIGLVSCVLLTWNALKLQWAHEHVRRPLLTGRQTISFALKHTSQALARPTDTNSSFDPQDAAARHRVRAAGGAGAAPICRLPAAAHRSRGGHAAAVLLHPGRLGVPGALTARGHGVPHCESAPVQLRNASYGIHTASVHGMHLCTACIYALKRTPLQNEASRWLSDADWPGDLALLFLTRHWTSCCCVK